MLSSIIFDSPLGDVCKGSVSSRSLFAARLNRRGNRPRYRSFSSLSDDANDTLRSSSSDRSLSVSESWSVQNPLEMKDQIIEIFLA